MNIWIGIELNRIYDPFLLTSHTTSSSAKANIIFQYFTINHFLWPFSFFPPHYIYWASENNATLAVIGFHLCLHNKMFHLCIRIVFIHAFLTTTNQSSADGVGYNLGENKPTVSQWFDARIEKYFHILSFWNTFTFPGFLPLIFERREHFLTKNGYQLEIGLPRWR